MKTNRRDILWTDLQILVLGLLSLLLVVLTVLEVIPSSDGGMEVRQPVTVSSSSLSPIDAIEKDYQSQINGVLFNPTDDAITVEAVNVTVSDGKSERTLILEGFTLPARSTRELLTSFEGKVCYDRVTEVSLVHGGMTDVLPNGTSTAVGVSGVAILYAILLLVTVPLTVRAAKVRYYLHQEARAR